MADFRLALSGGIVTRQNQLMTFDELRSGVSTLVGHYCLPLSGPPVGSRFYLDFDADPASTAGSSARFTLGVGCAAWRIDNNDGVVTSWKESDNGSDGPMHRGLAALGGRRVEAAAIAPPACDLCITFSGGWKLLVFCDELAQYGNFVFKDRGHWIQVGSKGLFKTEHSETWRD